MFSAYTLSTIVKRYNLYPEGFFFNYWKLAIYLKMATSAKLPEQIIDYPGKFLMTTVTVL
jgi:hypothetical protein